MKAGTDIMIYRKTTKEILGESLHDLAHSKNVDKITVKEITENCEMSPGTFYHHFHDKYELIAWIYNYQMEDIFLDFCAGTEDWRQTLVDIITILDWFFSGSDLTVEQLTNYLYRAMPEKLRPFLMQAEVNTDDCK